MEDGLAEGLRLAGALLTGAIVTALAVGPARRLAIRTNFFDLPVGYKRHARPTPYLGGLAVISGFLLASMTFGGEWTRFAPIWLCSLLLLTVGTLDDRVGLSIAPRLATQVIAAFVLWLTGTGWAVGVPAVDLALTLIWVTGITNAFNLMDNLDGATGTVALTSALGAGTVAAVTGDPGLGVLAFALAGACGGFLPYNLAVPPRIFLGDGGSLSIGFVVAAVIMGCSSHSLGLVGILAVAPLAGLPIFDTVLVVVSRYRRKVTILSGGHDHLTHRLYARIQSARRVAMVLAVAQGALCLLALSLHALDPIEVAEAAAAYSICGLVVLILMEGPLGREMSRAQEEQPA